MTRAVVIGSGPNGLSAAVTLARAGVEVEVVEAADHPGGGLRTAELTLPGFQHDVCSAVHPFAQTSPFFRAFQLDRRIEYRRSEVSFAHGITPERAVLAYRDIDRTADSLGRDARAYRSLVGPLASRIEDVADLALRSALRFPRHPGLLAMLGARVAEQGSPLWRSRFSGDAAPALLLGAAAHAVTKLPSLGAAAAGIVLAAHAHTASGWPVPVGGAGAVAAALIEDLTAHGGSVTTGRRVNSIDEFPDADIIVADTSARALHSLAGHRLHAGYLRSLARFRYGSAIAKIDLALDGPIPWTNSELTNAPTVHLGGPWRAVRAAENAVAANRHPATPFVLVVQPSILDPTRAPDGRQTAWAYAHVPAGSDRDMQRAILDRIEAFAPGTRDRILGIRSSTAVDESRMNPNYVGGDIAAGAVSIRQLIARPVFSPMPWRTPARGLYLCSASTVPGPGIHGMGGFLAASTALADIGLPEPYLGL